MEFLDLSPYFQNGIAYAEICHLVHIQSLDHLMDAQRPDGLREPTDGIDSTDADEQGVISTEETCHIPLQRSFSKIGSFLRGIPCDMDPGIASGPVGESTAGEPAILSARIVGIIQSDLQTLDQTVSVTYRDQIAFGTGQRPCSEERSESREAQEVMTTETKGFSNMLSLPICLRHAPIQIFPDPLVGQTTAEEIFPMLVKQGQVSQKVCVCCVPLRKGKRLSLRSPWVCLAGKWVCSAVPSQFLIRLFVSDSLQLGIERDAVPAGTTEIAAEHVILGVEAEVIFPWVVPAEGTACFHFQMAKRSGIEKDAAPPRGFHDGNTVIDHAGETIPPRSVQAAVACTS